MARDRLGSDYSENMSDATTCSCTTSSIDKCSLRSCGMFHEPFFLHPPGTRPRDGIYINPMSAFIGEPTQKPRDNGESFYLHSPHDLVYTRITHLFCDTEKSRNGERGGIERKDETLTGEPTQKPRDNGESFYLHSPHDLVYTRITHLFCDTEKTRNGERGGIERKDETLTVKVDVHINNGNYKPLGNGTSIRSDSIKDTGSTTTDHAYEQICIRPEENDSVHSSSSKKLNDDASESGSRSRTVARRFSRSSSGSESSNMSSEIHCYSSTTSTPSLSRNSSNERVGKIPKPPSEPLPPTTERKSPPIAPPPPEMEKESNGPTTGPSIVKPPPPPPPPPPPDAIDELPSGLKLGDSREEKKDKDTRSETGSTGSSAANKSDVSCEHQPEVQAASTSSDTEDTKPNQVSHLVSKHMVLPFIPPKFINAADSNTLLKPSEYLKSICKSTTKHHNSLSKARSVDNLDIQSRPDEEDEDREEARKCEEVKASAPGPPPPPLPPMPSPKDNQTNAVTPHEQPESPKTPQPLATISIQDLTSVQLRRTNIKMHATKTFSAPPPRSVSMTNVSEPFFVQKTDLIAELKKTKDIPGIKKLKVERAKVEKTQEQNMITEISKAFSVSNFVDQIPEKDSSGNVIPIWKRQMLARKAAERAKKELEEQIARENEEKRQKAIPPWKRQLLVKKNCDEKKPTATPPPTSAVIVPPAVKIEITPIAKRDASPAAASSIKVAEVEKPEPEEKKIVTTTRDDKDDEDDAPIIPWRAQLRKTNSKLNIID